MMNKRPNLDNRLVLIGVLAVAIVALLACSLVANMISRGAIAVVPLAAGILLLMGNVKDSMWAWRTRQASTALFSSTIGLSLLLFGVGSTLFGSSLLRMIFYVPSIALLVAAVPMALGKPGMYRTYSGWTRSAISPLISLLRGRRNPPVSRPTANLNEQDQFGGQSQQSPWNNHHR